METQYNSEMFYYFSGNNARHRGIDRDNYFYEENRVIYHEK
jgi:hypothetical protein